MEHLSFSYNLGPRPHWRDIADRVVCAGSVNEHVDQGLVLEEIAVDRWSDGNFHLSARYVKESK